MFYAFYARYNELGLVSMTRQVRKMLEFYQQLRQTTGVVVVGPSGSGKSTLWKVLKLALSKLTVRITRTRTLVRTALLHFQNRHHRHLYHRPDHARHHHHYPHRNCIS